MESITTQHNEMAIIYWFYKELDVSKNHLELIRKHNPGAKIYGLFGGELDQAPLYEKSLGSLLDDFWAYPGTYGSDSHSKWIHGDLLLLDWYDKRGRNLEWDSVAVTQWDMLVLADINSIVPEIQKDQVFFSGFRDLDDALENRWVWTKPDGEHRDVFLDFCRYVDHEYGYNKRLKSCLYIFEVLTREFFEMYMKFPDKKIGMLEYKAPTLAHIFGFEVYQRDVGVYWKDKRESIETSPLNGLSVEIEKVYVEAELKNLDGWRLFHPYKKIWPV